MNGVRAHFNTHVTKPYSWRRAQLSGLQRLIEEHEKDITDALHSDVGKPHFEASTAEVVACLVEVRSMQASLAEWMRPERVPTPLALVPAESFIVREPFGVALIIAPFNYVRRSTRTNSHARTHKRMQKHCVV